MQYDVVIIGAGPAGATCALALRNAGLRILLLDKAVFPRDKVCGDAIPARAVRVLREVLPSAAAALEGLPQQSVIRSCLVAGPRGSTFTYEFVTSGYCAKRLDFDAFLMEQVQAFPSIEVQQGIAATAVKRAGDHWLVEAGESVFQARLLIGCDGANGIVARAAVGTEMDPQHHCAAVRAYYTGVQGLEVDRMEIHLLQGWLPGYFWIFPIGEGLCNVGFGMLSKDVAAQKISLRTALPELIATNPGLRGRFEGAQLQGKVQGFGLPLGSRRVAASGDGILLCGDAAALVDPATGEGIGNAMWSGQIAARWAQAALERGDLRAASLQGYSDELWRKLGGELRRKYLAQRLLAHRPKLLDRLIRAAAGGGAVGWLVRKVF